MSVERWEDYLEPGETLLWQGAPAKGLHVTPLMIVLTLLGLPSVVFGCMAVLAGLGNMAQRGTEAAAGFGAYLTLLGVPFVVAGVGLVIGPWYAALKAHQKVRYALSNRRAYVSRTWWTHKLESYPIGPDDPIELQRGRADTVWFSTIDSRDSEGGPVRERTGFHQITDGQTVYDLLRRIQRERA